MADPMIFQFLGDAITSAMDTYVNSTVPANIAKFTRIAFVMGALYYAGVGMLMSLGAAEGSLRHLMISGGKFLLVGGIALNTGNYMTWVVETSHGLETGLTEAFAGEHGANPSSVYQMIDLSVGKGWELAGELWNRASNRGITELGMMVGEAFNAVVIALSTLIIAMPAGAMIITSKTLLELLLGIGPFFIMMLLWPFTKGFFDRWFGEMMTVILQIALVSACLAFAMKVFTVVVGAMDIDSETASPFFDALRLLAITSVMLWVLYVAYQKAAALAGGMSTAAITLGGMLARASGLSRAAANTINPVSTRRDLESGMMVTGSRLDHLVAGNTVWNPRYTQHVLGQFGKNWGRARGGGVQGE